MRVCENCKVECLQREPEVKGGKIASVSLAASLEHAAIDQKARSCPLKQEAGTCYFSGSSKKTDMHDQYRYFAQGFRRC